MAITVVRFEEGSAKFPAVIALSVCKTLSATPILATLDSSDFACFGVLTIVVVALLVALLVI